MKLIVGLGNPGAKYAKTRHNIGFMLIDAIAEGCRAPKWRPDGRLDAELTEATLNGQACILAKPQTFMNNSGDAVQKLMQAHRMKPADVWIIHDEVDLDVAEIKVKLGGSAGSKGVQSVIGSIGADFNRIRVGIGQNDRAKEPSEDYVLRTMPEADIKACLDKLPEIINALNN
jgi:PTH1 family peptidyl-tRNA hydrolase